MDLVLFLSSMPTQAATVDPTLGLVTYMSASSCPSGWQDLTSNATYAGRVIKGAQTSLMQTVGTSLAADTVPEHTHTTWTSADLPSSAWSSFAGTTLLSASKVAGCAVNAGTFIDTTVVNSYTASDGTGTMSTNTANLPFVNLLLCKFVSGASFKVPANVVAFMDTTGSCPTTSGWAGDFSDANGRLLVFAPSSTPVSSANLSPASAVTGLSPLGQHTHTFNAASITPLAAYSSNYQCPSGSPATTAFLPASPPTPQLTWPAGGSVGSADLGIPYVSMRACVAGDGTGPSQEPPVPAIFFYNGDSCPSPWRDSLATFPSLNLGNRFLITYTGSGSLGVALGGDALNNALGHDDHNHTLTEAAFTFTTKACYAANSGTAMTRLIEYGGYLPNNGYGFTVMTTGATSVADSISTLVPYRLMRACSPGAVTNSPTASPTKLPTKFPTTTRSPTQIPSSAPTQTTPPVAAASNVVPIAAGVGGGLAFLLLAVLMLGMLLWVRRRRAHNGEGQDLAARRTNSPRAGV